MARNSPVSICITKQSSKREPKFHHTDRFLGAGKSIRDLFIMLNRGCFFRIGPVIILIYNDFLFCNSKHSFGGDICVL